jgi:hypothetical protein
MIRIVIAGDQTAVRDGLAIMLDLLPNIMVCVQDRIEGGGHGWLGGPQDPPFRSSARLRY